MLFSKLNTQVIISVTETISNFQNVPDTTYGNIEANVTSSILMSFEEHLGQTEDDVIYTTENVQVLTTNATNLSTGLGIASILDSDGKAYESLQNNDLLLSDEINETPIDKADVAMWIPEEFTLGAERGSKLQIQGALGNI